MDIKLKSKPAKNLFSTPLLQQTGLWARLKTQLGWSALAFDIILSGIESGDMLIILRYVSKDDCIAYVPYGPELKPDDTSDGEYLAILSQELLSWLPMSCIFIRWDIPWESPYAQELDRYDDNGNWLGAPETRICEARMNFGVRTGRLYKSPSDVLPPDTLIVGLNQSDDSILSKMKPKTRYNIRLAHKHGVKIRQGGLKDLDIWNALYSDTAKRNKMTSHGGKFFSSIIKINDYKNENIRLLIAEKNDIPLAAMFLSVSSNRASYLYGASSSQDRHLMAPYALQWAAMQQAKDLSCESYDFFGLSPRPDPSHPMYGLYTFKTGFGGNLFHRQGAWDYVYKEDAYKRWIAFEASSSGFLL